MKLMDITNVMFLAKLLLLLSVSMLIGIRVGSWAESVVPKVKQVLFASSEVYVTPDNELKQKFINEEGKPLNWQALLPEQERLVLEKYQKINPEIPETLGGMTAQILLSIEASADEAYHSAMYSMNTVGDFEASLVNISGFVVPIEFHADKTPSLIFIVPYYGACVHFPPPPPNQIVFARLSPGFQQQDLKQAYNFKGVLWLGLFEDPMGTSAYEMEVLSISPFSGEPDDFRSH